MLQENLHVKFAFNFSQGKGKVITYWLKGEKPNNKFLGETNIFQEHSAVPTRPSTPRPWSAYQESQNSPTKVVDLRRSLADVDFISERSIKINHSGNEGNQLVPECSKTAVRDETEVPLLSITEPSFDGGS